MSRIIFEANGVYLGRYAGPGGKAMFQLSLSRVYVQLDALDMESLLANLMRALHDEDCPFEELAQGPLVSVLGLVEIDSKGTEGRFTFNVPEGDSDG